MKKLLGISLVAVLAATPLMASAAEGDQVAKLNVGAVSANTNVATTSYVQGAYKAAADKIDAVIDDAKITTNGNYIDAGKSVAHNLGELDTAVKANEDAITILNGNESTNGSVAKALKDAKDYADGVGSASVAALDATVTQTAGTDGLALQVTEVDGVITGVTGSIAANTYDSYGSASAAQTAAEGYTDSAIAGLDATVSQTAGTDGLALQVTEVDGVITGVTGSIAANTYDAYGAAEDAETAAKAYTDQKLLTVYTTWGSGDTDTTSLGNTPAPAPVVEEPTEGD